MGLPRYGLARRGNVMQWDSAGKVIVDRTYENGKLIEARDRSFGSGDTLRERIALRMEGVAAMSYYPFTCVFAGPREPLNYYENARMPAWEDSVFIPGKVMDSISYLIAGAYLALPDSFGSLRDSIFGSTVFFHPSSGVWYYTLEVMMTDTSEWMKMCRKGFIRTGNNNVDYFFTQAGYEIVSFGSGYSVWNYTSHVGNVVIRTKKPLNVIAFYNYAHGSDRNMILYYGPVARKAFDDEFYIVRTCDGIPEYGSKENPYAIFRIVRNTPQSLSYSNRQLVFMINSDGTVDFAGHGLWGNFYLLRFNSRHW